LTPAGALQDAVFLDSLHGWVVSKAGIVQRLRGNPLLSAGGSGAVPSAMRLDPAWPNPVAGNVVMLPFALSRAEVATLRVFNSTGREVATPLRGTAAAGEHAVRFDTDGLPGGVYFYSLETATTIRTRRFILLR
jgi:hypothetical protein